MNRKIYETTKDYQKAVELIRSFVKDELDGEVEKLKTYDLAALNPDEDPDMMLITQAIYIVLWGDIYDLTFDNMGSWGQDGGKPYRGDTMNSFRSLIGKEAWRAKEYGADKIPELWEKVRLFDYRYHSIGNFIVLPNRGTRKGGINGRRGNYKDMRDYFDAFLVAIDVFQEKLEHQDAHLTGFERQLLCNAEYLPSYRKIREWEDIFFLEPYFQEGKPIWLFNLPLEKRLKKASADGNAEGTQCFEKMEYLQFLDDYLTKSLEVIAYRSAKMVAKLQEYVGC